jgi:hypothetical protein
MIVGLLLLCFIVTEFICYLSINATVNSFHFFYPFLGGGRIKAFDEMVLQGYIADAISFSV